MKKSFLLITLLFCSLFSFSQKYDVKQVNELIKQEAIIKNLKEQEVLFKQIEFRLSQPQRIEEFIKKTESTFTKKYGNAEYILTKKDSTTLQITGEKILLSKYIEIKNKYAMLLALKLTDDEKKEVDNYYTNRLSKIDEMYLLFRESPNTLYGRRNSVTLKKLPSCQSCVTRSASDETCLRNMIYATMKTKFSKPTFRKLQEELYTTTLLVITKDGYLEPKGIQNSSNHFEYDFETLLNFVKTFDNMQFIPARTNENEVEYYITIPFSYTN